MSIKFPPIVLVNSPHLSPRNDFAPTVHSAMFLTTLPAYVIGTLMSADILLNNASNDAAVGLDFLKNKEIYHLIFSVLSFSLLRDI